MVGIAIAYGVFRKGRPLTISAVFEPILGKRQTYGPAGKIIDIFAIFATLFGSATSLGLGALQIAHGTQIVGWTGETGNRFLVLLITGLTICFVLSAVSGVGKGIQYLSNINMVLAVALALFVFVLGPTVFILNLVPTTLGTYLQTLMQMSARTAASGKPHSAQYDRCSRVSSRMAPTAAAFSRMASTDSAFTTASASARAKWSRNR